MSIFDYGLKEPVPGTIGTLPAMPIGVSVIAVLAVAALVTAHAYFPAQRETIEFGVLTAGVAGGLIGAFYVWLGLRANFQQREAARKEDQIKTAFRYVERINDPQMAEVRKTWRAVVRECEEGKANICDVMRSDLDKRTAMADITNLLEETGYATKKGIADPETVKEHLADQVTTYFALLRPWVDVRRKESHQPKAMEHFEWLYDQWKNR